MAKNQKTVSQKQSGTPVIKNEQPENKNFAIPKENYMLLLVGFVIIVLGFILMAGGGSKDPNEFNADKLFSFRRITLSTILVLFGFAFEIYAIMRKPKDQSKGEQKD